MVLVEYVFYGICIASEHLQGVQCRQFRDLWAPGDLQGNNR